MVVVAATDLLGCFFTTIFFAVGLGDTDLVVEAVEVATVVVLAPSTIAVVVALTVVEVATSCVVDAVDVGEVDVAGGVQVLPPPESLAVVGAGFWNLCGILNQLLLDAAVIAYAVLQMRFWSVSAVGLTPPSDCCAAAIASIGTLPLEFLQSLARVGSLSFVALIIVCTQLVESTFSQPPSGSCFAARYPAAMPSD